MRKILSYPTEDADAFK